MSETPERLRSGVLRLPDLSLVFEQFRHKPLVFIEPVDFSAHGVQTGERTIADR